MAEPIRADIELFATLTSLPAVEAIKWLKAHNNNVNNATNAYWDNPDSLSNQYLDRTWDENQFHSDNGQQGQSRSCEDPWEDLEAFTVHSQDTLNPNVFVDSAPSRPPSRVSTRGVGAAADFAVGSQRQLTVAEQEAKQVEQALALSMGQDIPGQESGVTDASFPYFGPAKREDHDAGQWAVATVGSHAKEILLNPDPINRKRQSNEPAFFKPTPQTYQLSALIKILQAIPMAREALLSRESLFPDYGYDTEWWDGTAIKVPKVVNLTQEGHSTDQDEVIYETQRLIAFLEETERAYGSTDALANMDGIRENDHGSVVVSFLEEWRKQVEHATPNAPLLDVFRSVGRKDNPNEPECAEESPFLALELRIDDGIAGKGQTLYEAVDDMLWAGLSESSYEHVYLERLAEMLIIEATRVGEAGSGLGIKIPSVWYGDRYLQASIRQVKEMRAGKAAVQHEISGIDEAKAKIAQCGIPALEPPILDATHLLKTTSAYFETSEAKIDGVDEVRELLETEHASPDRSRHGRISDELKALTERIAKKLKTFEVSKERAREKLDEFSKLYTKPSDEPNAPPQYKYTLRGVCSSLNTMYVLEMTRPDSADDVLSSDAKDWQWWKIGFIGTDSKPVSRTKVREIEVLKAAKDESRTALLVYASEKAMSYECGDLPSQLRVRFRVASHFETRAKKQQNFVRADNLSFAAELEKSTSPKPMTPTKRKADDSDGDEFSSKFFRSSPQRKENAVQPSRATDPTLPAYTPLPSPPLPPSRSTQTATRNHRNVESYDDMIPPSLRSPSSSVDSTNMMLDEVDRSKTGQEMLDRGGRILLPTGNEQVNDGYQLGSYVPEITMEDHEDEVGQNKHVEFADAGPKT
ncbi:hypothetical protein MMC07_008277 [Pseudocyphellaria aurata]|nr:hypothetical protein [Pseudocyphellaria aurata]